MESVLQLTYPTFRVYLVDNYSSDESAIILKEQFENHPKVNLIFNNANLGFTRANNEILAELLQHKTKPPYVALLNNDTIVQQDWLTNLVRTAEQMKAAVVSSKMIDYYDPSRMDNAGHLMLNTGEILPIGHGLPIDDFNQGFENLGACAGACLYSTEMLNKIGIFDEYFQTGYEDAELGVRATMAGYKCIYEPTAVVYHKMGSSIKKVFNYDYALSIQKKVLYTYFKLMPFGNLLVNLPFWLLRYTIIILVQCLFFRFQQAKLMIQALWETLVREHEQIITQRKQFQSQVKLGSLAISKKQTFFIWNNVQRFYRYFIQQKPSALDAYGKKELI